MFSEGGTKKQNALCIVHYAVQETRTKKKEDNICFA